MIGRFDTPEGRWAGIGPYYAMFPMVFANEVISKYSQKGDIIVDPFAGRATSIYSAALLERIGLGIEINPVGWVYGQAKLRPARKSDVESAFERINKKVSNYLAEADNMPMFFKRCFSREVRKFLLAARAELNWKRSASDRTAMALLLVYLHGKSEASLSNQLRQTKSMSPNYAVQWWKDRKMSPPVINPLRFMKKRVEWRYAKGQPEKFISNVFLGDCLKILPRMDKIINRLGKKKIKLLFTSPPYYGLTDYHYDQWLRLWLLGYSTSPANRLGVHRNKFTSQQHYRTLLEKAFLNASKLMCNDAIVYVRTDSREFTLNTSIDVLQRIFPDKQIRTIARPFTKPTQTHLFGNKYKEGGEIDIILEPK